MGKLHILVYRIMASHFRQAAYFIILISLTIFFLQFAMKINFFRRDDNYWKVPEDVIANSFKSESKSKSKSNGKGCYDLDDMWRKAKATLPYIFHPVESKNLFVFSVYARSNSDRKIRFVGMAIHKDFSALKCVFLEKTTVKEVPAKISYIPEGHNLPYDAVYVECVSPVTVYPGVRVGIRITECRSPDFFMPIYIVPPYSNSKTNGLSACIAPMYDNFNNVNKLIQFVELNRILGITNFYVYMYSVGNAVKRVIQKYKADGIMTVIPWEKFPLVTGPKYPTPKEYQIHYFGQMVFIHDCLFRAMNNPYRYLAFIDYDEFIIPRTFPNLVNLTNHYMSGNSKCSGLSFSNVMFGIGRLGKARSLETDENIKKYDITCLMLTRRNTKIYQHRDRSKMIINPYNVNVMGIHFVWNYRRGLACNQPASVGLLNHYRAGPLLDSDIVDQTVVKFKNQLIENIIKAHQSLG